jgi:hypothetical protein
MFWSQFGTLPAAGSEYRDRRVAARFLLKEWIRACISLGQAPYNPCASGKLWYLCNMTVVDDF